MNGEQAKSYLPILLKALRLPTINKFWEEIGYESDKQVWESAKYPATL
jgi:hypothetical protein